MYVYGQVGSANVFSTGIQTHPALYIGETNSKSIAVKKHLRLNACSTYSYFLQGISL